MTKVTIRCGGEQFSAVFGGRTRPQNLRYFQEDAPNRNADDPCPLERRGNVDSYGGYTLGGT